MNLDEILEKSPDIPGYGGGKWAMYSVNCCWWTSYPDDLGVTAPINGHRLPCCPHCGSVLMQAPLADFINSAKQDPTHYGKGGLGNFTRAHSRNARTCHRNWAYYEPPRLRHG